MRKLPALTLLAALAAAPAGAQTLHLERAVLLMRHGVRPPTHEPALDPAVAPSAWPGWEVPDGDLTPRGAAAISLLAAYDRVLLAPLATGKCPDVSIYTDIDERTEKTGAAYAQGFAPGCAVTVSRASGATDPLFSPLDIPDPNFDAKAAKREMLAAAGGDLNAPVQAHLALFQAMQNVLAPGQTAYLGLPAKISAKIPGRVPKLSGPIAEGASAAEDFLLEYLDGKPMNQVAWGRADAAQISALLALHPLAYTITARPEMIARATAAKLADGILADLQHGPAVSVLVGHDTNQAELGGLLGLHWSLPGYPADDPPPGSGLLFSLLGNAAGQQYVTVTYQVQSMAQIRGLQKLDTGNKPELQAIPIPGCGNSPAATACTLQNFAALVQRAR